MDFKDWLMIKFKEWEIESGSRKNFVDFARYLDVKPPTLTRWLNGDSIPAGDSVFRIAAKLSPQVFEILGINRPSYSVIEFFNVPKDTRELFFSILREIDSAFSNSKNAPSPEETSRIINSAISKHGLTWKTNKAPGSDTD